jgi:hypothetical protein
LTYFSSANIQQSITYSSQEKIKELAKHLQAVVVYDNINFKDTKRDEHVGHKATMQAMTTACIIHCPFLPETGLTQDMHNPNVQLDHEDILLSPGIQGDIKSDEITRGHISDAIRRMHPRAVQTIFEKSDLEPPQIPTFQKLEPKRTRYWQLGAINENEGTISGTMRVHDNMFLQQFGLSSSDASSDSTPGTSSVFPVSTTPVPLATPSASNSSVPRRITRRSTKRPFQAYVQDDNSDDVSMQESEMALQASTSSTSSTATSRTTTANQSAQPVQQQYSQGAPPATTSSTATTPTTSVDESPQVDPFRQRLWLAHGDQLTAHHIRSVKDEQALAELPYDRRDWLLGIPAWFHINMNLIQTVVRTHWEATGASNPTRHCLRHDTTLWGRAATQDNAMYHVFEPILAQSFTSRVVALFYTAMERRGLLLDRQTTDLERPDGMNKHIARLTPVQYLELVEDVRVSAFTKAAWDGVGHADPEFQTMCRMLQEIEVFLSCRYAVKYADIGLLRRMVDPLIVLFLGAGKVNYGHEMLFYRWLLSDKVCTPELQHAILASGIVNWLGRPSTHKAIDLGLEHDNGKLKINMKCYQNSTHNTDAIFDRVCLTNTFVGALRNLLEGTFGEEMSGAHTVSSTVEDMFALARKVFADNLATPRDASIMTRYQNVFLSEDIIQTGLSKLAGKVEYFNQHYTRQSALSQGSYNAIVNESVERHVDQDVDDEQAESYGNVVDETADGVLDPTTNILSMLEAQMAMDMVLLDTPEAVDE